VVNGSEVRSLARTTGDEEWRYDAGELVLGQVSIVEDTGYVADLGGEVVALDLKNGEPRWSWKAKAPVRSPVVPARGKLFVADENGTVYALVPSL